MKILMFKSVLNDASEYCDTTDVPRRCSRQVHRNNLPTNDPETYYRVSVFLPVLDDIIHNLKQRFSDHTKQALGSGFLIPVFMPDLLSEKEQEWLNNALKFWKPILPDATQMQVCREWDVWSKLWGSRADKPTDVMSTLDVCDQSCFPTIHRLLQIFACQPVTTASPERSFSNLRRLKTWLRSKMKEERLSGLALISLNRDKLGLNDAEEILNRFVMKKARRLRLVL